MQFGKFRLHIIRECSFKLDGGAMFGVVPKALWSRTFACDQDNRIELACNLLFIDTGKSRVLVETGMGPRWSERERQRFELKSLLDHGNVLSSLGLSNEDVDAVVLSHLHFDHAGGAVLLKEGKLVPAFPKARYYAQKGEWELAHEINARGRASYRLDDLVPLSKNSQLELVEGDCEIVEGVRVSRTGGHTGHHQVITFRSEGEKGIFFADIMPTKSHISPPWVMGYDHYPLTSCDVKAQLLPTAARENWLVVLDHEPDVPWGHVVQSQDNKFEWNPLPAATLRIDEPSGALA